MHNDSLVFLSIGSNLGDREGYILNAIQSIGKDKSIQILKTSILLDTAPLDVVDQPNFLNTILKISTNLPPMNLLDHLQKIEIDIGRIRRFDKGPREIDIDILTYDSLFISTPQLTVPHHSLFSRPFIREILISMSELSIYEIINKGTTNENNYSIFSK
jgi:2-amino-4-hydroxy-6-hydroxymethyldihydropteridine diphosphokinase